jgi:hypothetical protein
MKGIPMQHEAHLAPRLDPARVCTLSPDGLSERLAWIRDEILPHARRTERLPSGLAWELEAAPGLAEKVDRLIALERECCASIRFVRSDASPSGRLRLEVSGIDPDSAVFRALQVGRERPGWREVAVAGGLGLLVSAIVCCVLPLAAAIVAGGAAATRLAALDEPWVIGLGALPAAAVAGRLLRRRRRAGHPRATGCGPAC